MLDTWQDITIMNPYILGKFNLVYNTYKFMKPSYSNILSRYLTLIRHCDQEIDYIYLGIDIEVCIM